MMVLDKLKEKTKEIKQDAEQRGQQALENARREIERRKIERRLEKEREKQYKSIEKEAYHRGRLKAARKKGLRRGQQHKTVGEALLSYAKKHSKTTPPKARRPRKKPKKWGYPKKREKKPIQWF